MAKKMDSSIDDAAAKLLGIKTEFEAPALTVREYYALHAPNPPATWRVRTPLDTARWCWTWADAMIATRDETTNPGTAETPNVRRP